MMLASWMNRQSHVLSSALAGCLLVALMVPPPYAAGQSNEFDQRLTRAIEQAQEELRAEGERIQEEQRARQEQLEALNATCRALSEELVEGKLAVARKQQELTRLRERHETLWAEQTRWQQEQADIGRMCQEVRVELHGLSRTLPASELHDEQNRQQDQLSNALANEDVQKAVSSTVVLIQSFLQEARTSAVYEAGIIDPEGHARQARVLRVGQSLFAYHLPENGRTAIAIAAPYEQDGFRWQEDLTPTIKQSIVATVDAPHASTSLTWLPIDVTGRMTAATGLSAGTLPDRLRAGGAMMIPLAFVALCLGILVADRLLVLVRQGRHSLRFCDRVLELCGQGRFEEAVQMGDKTRGVLSQILKVCLAHRDSPPALLDDAIQETFLHEFPKLERFLPSIRMLSSVAPMLGLLGTVTGIIATFDVITVVGSGQPRLMAGGIAEALITTATGLAIAIPGLLAHSVLSGKADSIIADTERFAATLSNLIKRRQHGITDGHDGQHDVLETAD